jgi:hypothetical protein
MQMVGLPEVSVAKELRLQGALAEIRSRLTSTIEAFNASGEEQ